MFFRRRKKKKNIEDGVSIPESLSLNQMTPDQQAVDDCEQIIEASRELEDTRAEYRLVTSYLMDVEVIEALEKHKREEIIDAATNVLQLDKTRNEHLNTKKKITDAQFSQMMEEENEMPKVIGRLKENENYLDAIKRDLNYLEGEKAEWGYIKEDCKRELRILRQTSYALLLCFAMAVLTILLASRILQVNTQLAMLIAAFLAALLGMIVFVKFQECQRDIRRSEININSAITLENHVKIKYVNIKNAVDYVCEKYHVKNSYELTYIWEHYLEAVKQQKLLRQTNADLEYYQERLLQLLHKLYLNDASLWLSHVPALIDKKEMVEVKHNLIVRRQKLRDRMQYNIFVIQNLQKRIRDNLPLMTRDTARIEQILNKIAVISGLQ